MKKKLRLSLMCLFLFSSIIGMAQSVVSGKVTSSEDGSPLPGVSIIIKGNSKLLASERNSKLTKNRLH